ncbi:MAG TPA: SH3 domain-containing protein [Candidatus Cybelea sp.]|nr:SH3 domain-containing protein [Candidatus Cybelea sp.]
MPDSPLLTDRLGRFRLLIPGSIRELMVTAGRRCIGGVCLPPACIGLLVLILCLAAGRPVAADSDSKLPLPRFASLDSSEVNFRVGPGEDKPKLWLYQRAGMPVEIIEEFDVWRRVRDYQGTVGWVKVSLLSSKRTAIVIDSRRTLHAEPDADSRAVALVDPGVIGKLIECKTEWCRLSFKGYEGWLKRGEFWGVYPNETVKD